MKSMASAVLSVSVLLLIVASCTQSKEIRARYPMGMAFSQLQPDQSMMDVEEADSGDNQMPDLRRRNQVLSARFKNVFGNSKVGSEFIPRTIDAYTRKGKLATSRKEVFNWQPKKDLLDYFLLFR